MNQEKLICYIKKFTKKDIKDFYNKELYTIKLCFVLNGKIVKNIEVLIKEYFNKKLRNKICWRNSSLFYNAILVKSVQLLVDIMKK